LDVLSVIDELKQEFGPQKIMEQKTGDRMPTAWIAQDDVATILGYLKSQAERPFRVLYDLTAIDERIRTNRRGQPQSDFTLVYQLLSFERNEDVRLKVALSENRLQAQSVVHIWPSADWYEREVWDMFGIGFDGHPDLRRILMPPGWKGHPLKKDHPARGTELGWPGMMEWTAQREEGSFQWTPEELGVPEDDGEGDFMILNLGPHHPGAHGLLRLLLKMDGEVIIDIFPDIGFHHRAQEKTAERQTWHTYIPYTDRIDYLAGFSNEFPYILAVEKLAGIEVPDRAKAIRVMLTELFRIANHLVWYGTFLQDLGALSPVFYTFTDREKFYGIMEAICGFRMHPGWFRIGGVAHDLPRGWEDLVRDFLDYMPRRLKEYDRMIMANGIFKRRTAGIGVYTLEEAIDWGVTGPNLRACGLAWDLRKSRPYSGYEQFDFDIPTSDRGDCYGRAEVRVEEMRQSLRIIEQCLNNMPSGPYKSTSAAATPPMKDGTMRDIETLIGHFLGVSWGPVIPEGEAAIGAEGAKGNHTFYLVSDGMTTSYRTRIRTPSFPHIQTVPLLARGLTVSDLIAILGSLDYVMGDVDR
jgi:NADH-quinone oxidoreductase subunit C/D